MTRPDRVTWRNRIRRLGPYTLPMIGLTLLTGGASQFGWAAGLGAGGVSVLLLEWERRTQDAAGGDQP